MSTSNHVRGVIVLSIAASLALPAAAFACGESLYRVGKGVAYRGYSAPIPATVVVYRSSQDSESLAGALAAAGHDVRLVHGDVELAAVLGEGGIDVVLGPLSIAATVGATGGQAFLPIASPDDSVPAKYERVLQRDDDLKTYLKQIHRSLKRA